MRALLARNDKFWHPKVYVWMFQMISMFQTNT